MRFMRNLIWIVLLLWECFMNVIWAFPASDTIVYRMRLPDDVLKIGVLSDAQFPENDELLTPGHFGVVMNGPKHALRAFTYLKSENVAAIIMNGDMVNAAGENAYRTYNLLLNSLFGKKRVGMPLLIYPMGNHEFYGEDAEKLFLGQVGLPLNAHYVLNGFHFISISCSDGNGGYSSDRLEYLRVHLEMASKESKNKPIVVVSHMPFDVDGFCGGKWESPQSKEMYRILKDYPQVVYLSGHSHYPLFDDKSFLQSDFTMVNTGSISYFDLDWNWNADGITLNEELPNEYVNPHLIGIYQQADISGRDEVNLGWMMTIDSKDNRLTLQRIDYDLRRPFGKTIVLSDWSTKKNFTYTVDWLENTSSRPTFDKRTSINISFCTQGVVDVSFDAACHDVLVKYYEMEVVDPNKKTKFVRFLAKGYYKGWDFPYKEHICYSACSLRGKYSLRIRAVDCWGKKSRWLEASFKVE